MVGRIIVQPDLSRRKGAHSRQARPRCTKSRYIKAMLEAAALSKCLRRLAVGLLTRNGARRMVMSFCGFNCIADDYADGNGERARRAIKTDMKIRRRTIIACSRQFQQFSGSTFDFDAKIGRIVGRSWNKQLQQQYHCQYCVEMVKNSRLIMLSQVDRQLCPSTALKLKSPSSRHKE